MEGGRRGDRAWCSQMVKRVRESRPRKRSVRTLGECQPSWGASLCYQKCQYSGLLEKLGRMELQGTIDRDNTYVKAADTQANPKTVNPVPK